MNHWTIGAYLHDSPYLGILTEDPTYTTRSAIWHNDRTPDFNLPRIHPIDSLRHDDTC